MCACVRMCVCVCSPHTLPVCGVSSVDVVKSLLTLSDGRREGQVCLHHPLLIVAVDNGFRGHGQRVAFGHVLGQGC